MQPFSDKLSIEKFYYTPEQFVKVPFITGKRRLNAGIDHKKGFKWVEIPYEVT